MDTNLDLQRLAFEYRNAQSQHAQEWLDAIEKHVADLVAKAAKTQLRDHFAGLAMQAFMAANRFHGYASCSFGAYELADAMLAAREAQS